MRTVDRLLAGYIGFLTVVIVARGGLVDPTYWPWLGVHVLFVALLVLVTRLGPNDRLGQLAHDAYPLVLMGVWYTELGALTLELGVERTFARDAIVQNWEAALFGSQISYQWIREAPSVFWSGLLHLAYFGYYPIIILGPLFVWLRGDRPGARRVILALMIAFVTCYTIFALFPVAGPNYAFEHPTGPVREVWSAKLVYSLLEGGSAFGTAFPSSHVAATVATTVALWFTWRRLSALFLIPTVLLIIATVYCQMHYGVDALSALPIGVAAGWLGGSALQGEELRLDPSD